VELRIALSLPRDEVSVPLVRRLTTNAMRLLGIEGDCLEELQVALSEACANVLRHAQVEDDYEVRVRVDGEAVVIEVVDRGEGFDPAGLGRGDAPPEAEQGRGIQLMRALVDEVHFARAEPQGTVVSLTKRITFGDGAPLSNLAASS
jgi:serine/threonine-protein kinase RsbW